MNINLSDEQMRGIVAEAIFDKIDIDERRKLITNAVAHILEPGEISGGIGYGKRATPSPLAQAMQMAVMTMAREEVTNHIEQDGTREKVRAIVCDAFDHVFTDGEMRQKMVSTIAESFTEAIRVKSSY